MARFAAVLALAVGAAVLVAPTSATAGVVTTIAFETAGPVEVGFGDDWFLRLSVTSSYEGGPTSRLTPTDGSVDVYFSGIGGAFSSGLAIQPDGLVYVSQPTGQPLLPAGSYQVSAIFNPAPGGYFDSSQTATTLEFTVTAREVTPSVQVLNDPSVSERPVISASLSGSYIESEGGAPAGTWQFTVTDAQGAPVFDTTLAQAQGGTEPVRVEIDSKLEKGATYSVASSFAVVPELAGGVTAAAIPNSSFTTSGGTFGEALTALAPIPLWLAILLLVLLLGLAAAAIVIGVKLAGRKAATLADGSPAPQRLPGDPLNVEVVTLDEMGLPDPETIPELLPEGHTKKLPASTTWLLSDVEPATSLPDASEAPTERIDAVTAAKLPAAELPTEVISTGETPEIDDQPDEKATEKDDSRDS